MLPFENMVADYVKETENHVLYRVTPIFEGDNLVATGQTSLEQTMEKLNSIDFKTLNQAIADLSKVIEPLAKIASILK